MDYKKKYEEALERAKEIIECSKSSSKEVRMVLSFFPELKESEDEQMRKKCIELIKELKTFCMRDGQEECIAWLEKQGEHAKFRYSIQIGDKVTRNEDGVLVNLSQLNRVAKKDEKQGEQNTSEWRQDNVEELTEFENVMMHIGSSFFGENAGLNPNDTTCIKEQANLLLELVPKQEWSEEDIETIERIVCILDGIRYYNTVDNKQEKPYQSEIDWLKTRFKSLRPQSTWKPSDAQMEVLVWCKPLFTDPKSKGILESLIDDLKNL